MHRGTTLAPSTCMMRVLHAAIVLTLGIGTAGPIAAQRAETDAARDLRSFYDGTGDRAVWLDARGRPTADAHRVMARLRDAGGDGLEPDEYRVADLARQAAFLEADDVSAVDAAAFDVGLTASVLKYFRHLHLGRVPPRALGFHLDHDLELHDFPAHLRSALTTTSFDRVVDELRPAFAQYRELRAVLPGYRARDPLRARQIELALERLRWLPDVAGERLVVVNIPMFYVWGWEADRRDGVPAIGMPAIIGRAGSTKTPIFTSTITALIVNPDWTVPASIVTNEILPALRRNPHYLADHHMEMTDDGGTPRVRQLPGPWNALGRIKFVLPNVHGVYLHDTPTPALFDHERRDFSHGCVRVADPVALAAWILQDGHEWPPDRIRAAIHDGATRTVKVIRPPHVILFYMTAAFAPEDGSVRFADDLYGHDARLDAWLRARTDGGER